MRTIMDEVAQKHIDKTLASSSTHMETVTITVPHFLRRNYMFALGKMKLKAKVITEENSDNVIIEITKSQLRDKNS